MGCRVQIILGKIQLHIRRILVVISIVVMICETQVNLIFILIQVAVAEGGSSQAKRLALFNWSGERVRCWNKRVLAHAKGGRRCGIGIE